jgi:hypothetical protein
MQAADTAAGRVSAGRHQAASAPPCRWDLSRTRSPASRSACAAPAGRACA